MAIICLAVISSLWVAGKRASQVFKWKNVIIRQRKVTDCLQILGIKWNCINIYRGNNSPPGVDTAD